MKESEPYGIVKIKYEYKWCDKVVTYKLINGNKKFGDYDILK